jgi:hypothetical protein
MHTLKISTNPKVDLDSIVSYVNNSFTGATDEFVFNQYNGNNVYNPFDALNESRQGDIALSQSLAMKFQQLNDPRGNVSFGNWDGSLLSVDDAVSQGAPNGNPSQGQYNYPLSIVDYAVTAPTELLSYHEVLFLKAEAIVRLAKLGEGDSTDALPVLQAAIEDAFSNLNNAINISTPYFGFDNGAGLTSADADDYFTNYVTPRFASNALKEVMMQKYLAFYGASGEAVESYNDYRRLLAMGENSFTDPASSLVPLANPLNAKQLFPLRFAYGASDVTTNTNIATLYGNGNYVYSDPVWWAGGTH